ncbi:MAG: fibrinogen-like YCDxxxxGGGW domain-containing protein, partial [Bradymonadaceae bacterium]
SGSGACRSCVACKPGTTERVEPTCGFHRRGKTLATCTSDGSWKKTSTCQGVWYGSCSEYLMDNPQASSGQQTIDPDGPDGPMSSFKANCDMSYRGGGWTVIGACQAKNKLGGKVEHRSGQKSADKGFKPFFIEAYTSGGASSRIAGPQGFGQTKWSKANNGIDGDVSFGPARDGGPVTSYARRQTLNPRECSSCSIGWPQTDRVYRADVPAGGFRIGWGEGGAGDEGWQVWSGGKIWLRSIPRSCSDVFLQYPEEDSGVFTIDPGGPGNPNKPFEAYCLRREPGQVWTLALKADGKEKTFKWNSPKWEDSKPFKPGRVDFDRREAELRTYNQVPAQDILVAMEFPYGSGSLRGARMRVDYSLCCNRAARQDDTLRDLVSARPSNEPGAYVNYQGGWEGLNPMTNNPYDRGSRRYHLSVSNNYGVWFRIGARPDNGRSGGIGVGSRVGGSCRYTAGDVARGQQLTCPNKYVSSAWVFVRNYFESCQEIGRAFPHAPSGSYTIDPDGPYGSTPPNYGKSCMF